MFNLKAITLLLTMGIMSVTAAPASDVSSEGELVALDVPSSYNDYISSIKNLDKGRFHCVWYEHGGCRGRSYSNQEDANLHDGNGFFSDRISSWRCNTKQGRVAAAGVDAVEGGEQQ
ncbi:hypothetical protein QBC40DRAFT_162542 [Triangularia verruculosa]|uniref:Uncharacterized protein n=1 Tax=Triangularia verruculosa TaxID=2587418 RepID=A0AAN7B200_9PEZI|nr:hypothetical protein QBC40DRAFT_162542 [Triangularia verruculosa]